MSLCLACLTSPEEQAYCTPCCSLPICRRCCELNPRLKEYDPCLRCAVKIDEPPVYAERSDQGEGQGEAEGDGVFEHVVRRGESLRAIARRYAVDVSHFKRPPAKLTNPKPYELLKLNNLPPAALLTNPTLIQTRKTVRISSIRPETSPARELKRFQIVTKTADPAIGKVYLAFGGVERYYEDDEWERDGCALRERVRDGKWVGVRGSPAGLGEKRGVGHSKEKY